VNDVRLAVAGIGLIGRRHVEAIHRAAGVRLAAVVDPDDDARHTADVPWFPNLAELPPGTVDGVILATPNAAHVDGGLACVAMGLPVLVEKPLATDTAGARQLVDVAEAHGVALLTGHHRRHNPLVAAAKAIIDSGEIGRVVSVQSMFWLRKPDDYFDVEWRRHRGAGPVFVNLIHDIDLLRHLVGEITAVQAIASNAVRGFEVEDTAVIVFEFESGALGTANVSDAIPAPWSWELTSGENPVLSAHR
jgi:predicted dehydrogenase